MKQDHPHHCRLRQNFAADVPAIVKAEVDIADTLVAIAKYGIKKQVGYISTSGAFLEVLDGKTLPAFEILQQRAAE